MASCKGCKCVDICYKYRDICAGRKTYNEYFDDDVTCSDFIDRTRFVELPCKVGDTVYVIENNEIIEDFVDQIGIGYYCDGENIYQMDGIKTDWYFSDIGKTVFLTREEAERALNSSEKSNG